MRSTDLLDAMGSLSEKYIEEASQEIIIMKREQADCHLRKLVYAAAVLALSIILPNTNASIAYAMQNLPLIGGYFKAVTIREYHFEDERHEANVAIPEIIVETNDDTANISEQAEKTIMEINENIQKETDSLIAEFEAQLKADGYSTLEVTHQTVTDTEQWYCLKLTAFTAQADGYECNRYYVIDKATGKRIKLSDLFEEGYDYITPISESIRKQMRDQKEANEEVSFFIDDQDMPELNFKTIDQDQQFYINSDGDLVICFDEGEVAPMYMGTLEFIIPEELSVH